MSGAETSARHDVAGVRSFRHHHQPPWNPNEDALCRVVAGALFLLCAGTALAQVATCPGVVYDRYGTRKWTLAESHIKVSGGFSIFGISIIESEVTLVAVYVAEDGTRRSVDCRDIT